MHSLRPCTSAFHGLANVFFFLLLASLLGGCTGYTGRSSQVSSQSPSLALSAKSLTFSTVVVGQTQSQTLKLSNSGNAPLRLTSLSVSNLQFSIAGPSIPATILPSENLAYTVAFSPTSAGSDTATLDIASDASNGIVALPLAGTGEKAFADLVVTPASVNFGNLNLKAKGTQNITLQNTGDVSMMIQGVTLLGSGFGSSLSPGFSLSPNQSLSFQVWFTPQVKGPASATMSFLSPGLSSPATLSLSGDGIVASSTSPPPAPPQGSSPAPPSAPSPVPAPPSAPSPAPAPPPAPRPTPAPPSAPSPAPAPPPAPRPAPAPPSAPSPAPTSPSTPSSGEPSAVQHTVQLNWDPSPSAVIGYRVYRSQTSGSSFTPLTASPLNALTYADTTVASGATYYYVVTSVSAAGTESVYSNQVTAAIPSP